MMNEKPAGSYTFGEFAHNGAELERLRRQATAALHLEKEIWRKIGLKPGLRVLDLACGAGQVTCQLAQAVLPHGSVLGVDISPVLLDLARQRSQSLCLDNVEFLQSDVHALTLAPGQFDLVYARFLLQHLSQPVQALARTVSLLKPGGCLCLLDIDDQWQLVQPEPPEFAQFMRLAQKGQEARGGDRFVGRKLPGYLHQAGLGELGVFLQSFTSFDADMTTFLDIVTRLKLEEVGPEDRPLAQQLLEKIYALCQAPFAWGITTVVVALGRRPQPA